MLKKVSTCQYDYKLMEQTLNTSMTYQEFEARQLKRREEEKAILDKVMPVIEEILDFYRGIHKKLPEA